MYFFSFTFLLKWALDWFIWVKGRKGQNSRFPPYMTKNSFSRIWIHAEKYRQLLLRTNFTTRLPMYFCNQQSTNGESLRAKSNKRKLLALWWKILGPRNPIICWLQRVELSMFPAILGAQKLVSCQHIINNSLWVLCVYQYFLGDFIFPSIFFIHFVACYENFDLLSSRLIAKNYNTK